MNQEITDWYLGNGYTLMSHSSPEIGARFHAARVVCERGFGAVILRTRRIGVPATRIGPTEFFDDLNQCHLSPSEIEAWLPSASTNVQNA